MKRKLSDIEKTILELAELLPLASSAFVELLRASRESRSDVAKRLHEVEDKADDIHDGLIGKVSATFITPYDREDLYVMLASLDDVFDRFDDTAKLIVAFDVETIPPKLVEAAVELEGMCEAAVKSVPLIKESRKMSTVRGEMKKHEHRLDDLYCAFLVEALVPDADPINTLRMKIVADTIEEVAAEVESFVRSLRVMAIKET